MEYLTTHGRALRVGLFLALRQVRRSSKWTTGLIILIMTLTFLNLVVVSGILVGLIEGSVEAARTHYTSDLILNNLKAKQYIEHSNEIIDTIEHTPGIERYTARYSEGGSVEANYKTTKRPTDLPEKAGTNITGIDPVAEDAVTGLSTLLIEGEYLEPDDYDQIIIGSQLLKKYFPDEFEGFTTLRDVELGSKVRLEVNGILREVTVKGITKSKIDEIDRRVFMVDSEVRTLIGRTDHNVDEIAVKLKPGVDPITIKELFLSYGFGSYADVQTYEDAQPKFLKDIKATFALLGNMISAIGLAVAVITVFIVIFINAITRRKFIGILKGVGIEGLAIEVAYITQSLFYAFVGTSLGFLLVFGFLQPFIAAHPINFPFSDGILVATVPGTLTRAGILFLATLIAGYVPAKIVVRQNTLDAILGR